MYNHITDSERARVHAQWRAAAVNFANNMTENERLCLFSAECLDVRDSRKDIPGLPSPAPKPCVAAIFVSPSRVGASPRARSAPPTVSDDDQAPVSPTCFVSARATSLGKPKVSAILEEEEELASEVASGGGTPRKKEASSDRDDTKGVVSDHESAKTIRARTGAGGSLRGPTRPASVADLRSSFRAHTWGRRRNARPADEGLETTDSGSDSDTTLNTRVKVKFGAVPRPDTAPPPIRRAPTGAPRKGSKDAPAGRRFRDCLRSFDIGQDRLRSKAARMPPQKTT